MSLEKCTWKATLKPGKKAEYIRRHDEIWPEMTEVLTRAGIRNYTIWCCGDELFGYYECEKGAACGFHHDCTFAVPYISLFF